MKPMNQGQKWVLFSQDGIFNHYGEVLVNHLVDAQFDVELILLSDGEVAKSFSELENIYSKLIPQQNHQNIRPLKYDRNRRALDEATKKILRKKIKNLK